MMRKIIIILLSVFISTAAFAAPSTDSIFSKFKISQSSILRVAEQSVGTRFRPGVSSQCANFVKSCAEKANIQPPANASFARSWTSWGKPVNRESMRPGDVIIVWRGSPSSSSGHILIYKGDGKAIHRSSSSAPIQITNVEYYANRILAVRRAK